VEAAVALVSKERQKHDATVLSLQEALQDAVRQVRRVNSAISRRGLRLFELHHSTQMESIKMQHMDAMLEAAKQMRDLSSQCDELRQLRLVGRHIVLNVVC
jgi:chromatin segregation and condensation protein Rec8/ScpA/Scc1 (kleisin family)